MAVSLTLRNTKGSALTFTEMDTNLSNLKTAVDLVETAVTGTSLTTTLAGYVTLAGTQTITGAKTFSSASVFSNTATFNSDILLKGVDETVYTLTYGATLTPNASNGSIQKVTLTGNVTLSAFTNPQSGQSITFIITQDGTGSRTLTSTMKFAGGGKTLSTAAGSIDVLNVFYDGTNYLASLVKGYA